jgi:transcriptional regulator GlxA family with amidase domain
MKKRVDWADVACACGYFDQAHFANDFFAFAGLNPSAYLDHQLEGDPNFIRAVA